jgi:hypothetical protein
MFALVKDLSNEQVEAQKATILPRFYHEWRSMIGRPEFTALRNCELEKTPVQ